MNIEKQLKINHVVQVSQSKNTTKVSPNPQLEKRFQPLMAETKTKNKERKKKRRCHLQSRRCLPGGV